MSSAFAGRPTRWLEVGSTVWTAGEAVYLVGLVVYAFGVGGPGAVALVALLQALPSVVLAPLVLGMTARLERASLLGAVLVVRAASVGLAAIALFQAGTAPAATVAVFGLAALDGLASTILRPLRSALVPMIARSPEELVTANVAITTGMSAAGLVGPALAAVVLAAGSVELTFLLATGAFVAALATIGRLRGVVDRTAARHDRAASRRGGFAALAALPAARTILAVIVAQRFGRGMLGVLVATAALELVRAGDEGVGILNAAIGLGGLAGSALAVTLVGRARLAGPFAAAVVLWAAGLAAPGLVPTLLAAVVAFAVVGAGKAILEVAGTSLLQRTVPTTARGSVLALLESFVTAALAAGAVAASLLVDWLGPAGALLAAGGLEVGLVFLAWPWFRRVDDGAVVPSRELGLLRGVAFFRPLQLTTIEDLAGRLTNVRAGAGDEIVRQGAPGDRFYIVEAGRLETLVDGSPVRDLGPGDSFGEIALLRDVPRTATVRAETEASLVALARDDFLAAVEGHTESAAGAEAVVRSRYVDARPDAAP